MAIKATNTVTGVTKEFSPLEWQLMQDWAVNPWQKVPASPPKEANAAAKKAKSAAKKAKSGEIEINSEKDIQI